MSDSEIPNGWLIKNYEGIDPNTINDYFTLTNLDDTDKTFEIGVYDYYDDVYYTDDDLKWYKPKMGSSMVPYKFTVTLKSKGKIRLKNTFNGSNRIMFPKNTKALTGINASGDI